MLTLLFQFDPRTTGISVRCRQYFLRPHPSSTGYPGVWPPTGQHELSTTLRKSSLLASPPTSDTEKYASSSDVHGMDQVAHEQNLTYNLDPFLVEDPLSPENNVGRNAFRIFQIQRAFSDAHRAMRAALEWDMNAGGDDLGNEDYPLLKCLFQNEDQVFDM